MANTIEECAQQARKAGVNLFKACQQSTLSCHIYTKTQSIATCNTFYVSYCNVYKVTEVAPPTTGKSNDGS